jgi:putative ABC transport system ATP-binding protein
MPHRHHVNHATIKTVGKTGDHSMIKLENISIAFKGIPVLKKLCATVQAGDFIMIVGANGSGKSTLFDIIAGKRRPDSGAILFDDINVTRLNELKRAPLIARLFQNTHLSCVPTMSVAQNLALAMLKGKRAGLSLCMSNFPEQALQEIALAMNTSMDTVLEKPMGALSGGQRQTLSLIMSTLIPPKILLLDEPTAALDPTAATKLLLFANEFIRQHNITTLMITHDPHLALVLGNRLWILEDGAIKQEFGPEKSGLSPDHLIGSIEYNRL